MKKQTWIWVIFVLALIIRLYFTFQTPYFGDSTSYFNLRQIQHIKSTGLPIFDDNLSYSGRFYIFLPFFHYLLAFFTFFLPILLVAKLIPNIMLCSTIFIIYLISKKITKSENISIMVAMLSGFIPILFKNFNILSVYSLVVPLTFGLLYTFMKITDNKKYIVLFLVLLLTLAMSHQLVVILLLSLFVYLFFVWLEGLKYRRVELELVIFSCFFVIWLSFIIFKNAFLVYGSNLVYQNIPTPLIGKYFLEFNLLEAIYAVGIIPFGAGIFVIYNYIFKEKNRDIYLIISFAITIFLLIWLRLVKLEIGLIFFSIILTILSAKAIERIISYFNKTRFTKHKKKFFAVFFGVFLITSFIPSIYYASESISNSLTGDEFQAYTWIQNNTTEDSVILSTPQEGHYITSISKRKNVIDENFLLQTNVDQIYVDTQKIYSAIFETEALRLLNKYNVDYIILSNNAKILYGIEKLQYIEERCFTLVYDNSVQIFSVDCIIEEANET